MAVGEDAQDTGRDGLHAAKVWLDRTTRASVYTHRDRGFRSLLEFQWPHGNGFSFDIGGQFRGGDLDNQSFLGEVKNYRYESDLGSHFQKFLAECYVALEVSPNNCDHFLWISWAPFQARAWHLHCTAANVVKSLEHEANRERVFGTNQLSEVQASLDHDRAYKVAERVWLLTLSRKQEDLVLLDEHYGEVVKLMAQDGG